MEQSSAKQLVFLRKTTLVDYPERIAAAIFFPFCNLRCPWCHNGDLITDERARRADSPLILLEEAFEHIAKRQKLLDGVVLSGGEPTLFAGLAGLIAAIKQLPLEVKLDTNGTRPDVLAALLDSDAPPDYIAMDLKFAPERYAELLPAPEKDGGAIEAKIIESLHLVRAAHEAGRVRAEFRSLILPRGIFSTTDAARLAPLTGSVPWQFRAFRPGTCLDPSWNNYPETLPPETERFAAQFSRRQGTGA